MDYPHGFAIELSPPPIERWRDGNAGIPFYWTFDSGRPGPHVLINAITHGDELCGAIAVDRLLEAGVRPLRGRLSLGFANVEGYARWDPARPNAGFFVDVDLNRIWDAPCLDGAETSSELSRAREMRPLIDGVDLLLDIHSTQYDCEPMLMPGWTAKGLAMARALGFPSLVVTDFGHAAGTRLHDYGAFSDEASPRNATVVECGQHWRRGTDAVALEAALVFLDHHAMIAPELRARLAQKVERHPPRVLACTDRITVEHDDFAFARVYRDLESIERAGTCIGVQGGEEIRTPYDDCILIMPVRKYRRGTTAVRFARRIA